MWSMDMSNVVEMRRDNFYSPELSAFEELEEPLASLKTLQPSTSQNPSGIETDAVNLNDSPHTLSRIQESIPSESGEVAPVDTYHFEAHTIQKRLKDIEAKFNGVAFKRISVMHYSYSSFKLMPLH